jgi:hypothetical protein
MFCTRHSYLCCWIILRVTDKSALTKRCWIVVAWAHESKSAKERHKLLCWTLVDTLSLSQGVQVVKHLKEPGTWLVDGADDCTTTSGQWLQQWNALEAGRAVQTTEKKKFYWTPRAESSDGFGVRSANRWILPQSYSTWTWKSWGKAPVFHADSLLSHSATIIKTSPYQM